MKKLLLLFVASFCIGVAMAQEPKKVASKKTSQVKLKGASEADRIAAKKKHYEALKSSEAQAQKADTKANTVSGARTKSSN